MILNWQFNVINLTNFSLKIEKSIMVWFKKSILLISHLMFNKI